MSIKYSDVRDYVSAGLAAKGYGSTKPMPRLHPGPYAIDRLTRLTPGPLLFLVVGGGLGLTNEGTHDQTFITARAIGKQNDYDFAETLAADVDRLLLDCVNGKTLGTTRPLYVTRTGGGPQLVELDQGERSHFQCTYITEAVR